MDWIDAGFLIIIGIGYVGTSRQMKKALVDYIVIVLCFYGVYEGIVYLFFLSNNDTGKAINMLVSILFLNRFFNISSKIRAQISKDKMGE